MTEINVPWPASILNPNYRAHWAPMNRAAQKARRDAHFATLEAKAAAPEGRFVLRILARPPRAGRRDADNVLASLKSTLDGVADGLGVDDSRFMPKIELGEPDRPFGSVVITIEAAE